jgi:glycosyltransferase involved in cell wall biosynthesis
MIRVFLNGMGANTASGLTYLRNVLPQLSRREDVSTTVAINPRMQAEFLALPNIRFAEVPEISGAARRFWFEQTQLPKLIRKSGAAALISAGNFALRKSPVPQILLSGNSLYTSEDFGRDLRGRGEYAMWADNRARATAAKRSVGWADCTVAPTRAFADELQRWTGKKVVAIHHGFDREVFFGDRRPLSAEVREKLESAKDCIRLLHVSHYNYFRNFETLFRAVPRLKQLMPGKKIRLFLTCNLQDGENPGAYKTQAAAALVKKLGISEEIVELGAVPYRSLHQVYQACDLYVTASYAETFAHPLVEAMACGVPVVASDLAVHREVGGDAAEYFPRFDSEMLAERAGRALGSDEMRISKIDCGRKRSLLFRWDRHVQLMLNLVTETGQEKPGLRCA